MSKGHVRFLAAAILLMTSTATHAATATGSFSVHVVIQETYTVASPPATTLDFGTQSLGKREC